MYIKLTWGEGLSILYTKNNGMEVLHPDMTEQISVALTFDKTLKYVKFINDKFCPESEENKTSSQNQTNAFKMMTEKRFQM